MSDFSTLPKSRPRNSRRRSLKALLQLPPSFSPTKTPAHARPDKEADNDADSDSSRTQAVCRDHAKPKSVPFDIIVTIAELLCPGDVLSFSLASSAIRHLLLPTLYTSVVLKSSQKCFRTLLMLLAHPDICSYIRKLAVRPNYYLSWPRRDGHLDEDWVADMIARIAPSLVLLNWFDWDGLEMPGDRLWEALRKSCPQLRNISTNLGTRLVHSGCKVRVFPFNFVHVPLPAHGHHRPVGSCSALVI
ncbi:hypothetical protein AX15_000534 [Amanita polypyramis BW_CC]|nr:hypothetical protein AX15_000534 [Amanita polypyramis BW_CC]